VDVSYAFAVLPWLYASPSIEQYNYNYNLLANIQNMVIVAGWGALWLGSRGAWRLCMPTSSAPSATYLLSSLTINVAIANKRTTPEALHLPLLSNFLWFAWPESLPINIGTSWMLLLEMPLSPKRTPPSMKVFGRRVFAMAAVISLPIFRDLYAPLGHGELEVRDFRLMATLIASVPLALLIFLRTHLADKDAPGFWHVPNNRSRI